MDEAAAKRILKRPIQYLFEDGIVELVTGGMLLLVGALFFLQEVVPSSWGEWLPWVFPLILFGGWYALQYLIRKLKERITFPRTGYVAYRKGGATRSIPVVAGLNVAVFTAGLLVFSQPNTLPGENLMPVFTGLVMADVLGLVGFYASLPRYYGLAAASLILGGAFTVSNLNNNFGTAAYCGVIGLVLLASGGVALMHYLHQNPVQTEASDDQ